MINLHNDFSLQADIPYLGEDRGEKMDAYLPVPSWGRSVPGVVLVHGDDWTGGSRKRDREVRFAETLARAGFAVFSIDYALGEWSGRPHESRLARSAWPQSIYDCKSAIRYVRHHSARFGVNPERMAIAGGSAGAHLALITAMTGTNPAWNRVGPYSSESSAVDCVVVSRGIYEVDKRNSHWLIDKSESDNPSVRKAASPLAHIERGAPPVLVFHGSKDDVVGVENAQAFAAQLGRFGIEHRLIIIPGQGHELRLDDKSADLMPIVETFLRWNLLCR